ncbi:MAG: sulfatase-like hydrolase/transferase [Byssovorax sp.]
MPSPEPAAPPLGLVPGRRRRALLVASALVIPVAWTTYDIVNRGAVYPYLLTRNRINYAEGALLGLAFWALGLEAARHANRGVRVTALAVLGVTAAFGIGGQSYFRTVTSEYVTRNAVLLAADMPGIITGFAGSHAPVMAAYFGLPALGVVAFALARARRFGLDSRRRWTSIAAVGALAALLTTMFSRLEPDWYQCLPPDMLWVNGSGGPILRALGRSVATSSLPIGQHEAPPPAEPAPDDAPSIVVLLGESVRRDEVCVARADGCTRSPAVDAAAPDRIGFSRSFSVASCTELAASVLWSGLPINAELPALGRAPLIWDYAKARGYRTAYLTSQNLTYQHLDRFLLGSRIDVKREARDRMKNPSLDEGSPDELLGAEAVEIIEKSGPALVLLHLSNTHLPYRQVPGYTPFAGGDTRVAYRNSLAHDDAVIGNFVTLLRRGERGRRAVVVSLSDHGEAFDEHHAVSHGFDLYTEEIAIPLWIDAPAGSLAPAVVERLHRDAGVRPVSTADVGATVIDLLGALDPPAFHPYTAALAGASLLRDAPPARDVLLWNCPPSRACAADAFGVVAWPMKLHYVGRELHYACHDLEADPAELSPLPKSRCAPLRTVLDRLFATRVEIESK